MLVGPEKSKILFFISKIHRTHKHSNTCHGLNFHHELKHCETHMNHCEPLVKHPETLLKHREKLAVWCNDIEAQCGDIGAWCGNTCARCSDIGAQRRVSGDIDDYGVGITLQMCNRVTNPWDMGILCANL